MKAKLMKNKILIVMLVMAVIAVVAGIIGVISSSAGDNRTWVCHECDKTFTGAAYYDYKLENVMCEDCARVYWVPLSYKDYKVD